MIKLRPYIQRWYDYLQGFQDYAALMFLQWCVPPAYKNIVISIQTLIACLQHLATYCVNEEMYCKRAVEYMKAQKSSTNFYKDKKLLNLFDNKLVDILGINTAYHIDFPTVKQLFYKLSSITICDKLCQGLDKVKAKYRDIYNTQHYVQTFRELLNIARIKIDEELDKITLNNFSS